jgi:hypothetical protein
MRRDEKSEGKFLIIYAGKFYIERDPQPLFRALRKDGLITWPIRGR